MGDIRTKTSSAVGAVDCVAVQARGALEYMSSGSFFFILIRRLLLHAYPGLKVFRTIYVHAQKHLRVLCPAVLRTLAEEQARLVGIQPRLVRVIRNQVGLSSKLGHPEAVIGVGGEQFQECRCGMSGVAYRDMEFVRGDDAEIGIPKFPPKLVADRGDLHCPCRPWRVLDGVDHAGGSSEQHGDDQDWDHRPGQLNLGASVHLSGLTPTIS